MANIKSTSSPMSRPPTPTWSTLQEVTLETALAIDVLKQYYPYIATSNWSSLPYGVIILSRHPLEDVQIIRAHYALMVAVIVIQMAGRFQLIAVHAPNSLNASIRSISTEYHAAWEHEAARTSLRVVVAGDFNAIPWSPRIRTLVSKRNLALGG